MSNSRTLIQRALDQGRGILRLAPNWVPRSFCVPGRRIKLHPDDYYILGGARGGIDERWFASTTAADNGPLTGANEGLSQVVVGSGANAVQALLRDAVAELKGAIVGERLWREHCGWPMFSKYFDNLAALPHHIHHRDQHARRVGQPGKPEAYYFPPQMNNHGGAFPYTFFGLAPGTTREQVRNALANFAKGDNRITALSAAYRLEVGTGWDVPPGILHAPGSLCTYEPQRASDVFAMYESVTGNQVVPEELLWKNTPEDRIGDVDYLLEVIDWEANIDPEFKRNHFMAPIPVRDEREMLEGGYRETWVCYKSPDFSAKELTVLPGRSVSIRDAAAYGLILTEGHGTLGVHRADTPTLIRYGQMTDDEFFVTEAAALEGVMIKNDSASQPLVMLKHFGPGNPDL
ncbi:MAG: hypothetical protein NT159_21835 [Proteobacteria bacterium]|nr:hypothetical protein [Pseudomonadota bacterium]